MTIDEPGGKGVESDGAALGEMAAEAGKVSADGVGGGVSTALAESTGAEAESATDADSGPDGCLPVSVVTDPATTNTPTNPRSNATAIRAQMAFRFCF